MQLPDSTHLSTLSTRVCSLEKLAINNITESIQHGQSAMSVDGVCFPCLKYLEVDLTFECLPLVSRVAESSPLLETFVLATLLPIHYCYYDLQQLDTTVVRELQTAISHMDQLKRLVMRPGLPLTNDVLTGLLQSNGGNELANRLILLEITPSSREMFNLALTRCRNLRHLTFYLPKQDYGLWNIEHFEPFQYNLPHLEGIKLHGECRLLIQLLYLVPK